MRIFLAGASGVIGRRLVPLLVDGDHLVAGTTLTPANAEMLEGLGAHAVVCDIFDSERLAAEVDAWRPDLVMHQVTALPDDPADIPASGPANARVRTEGTNNLLAAASAAGVERFLAQSVAWTLPGPGAAVMEAMEQAVLAYPGTMIRYGQFYGDGTYFESEPPAHPRIHIDVAAARTADLLDTPPGIVTVTEE